MPANAKIIETALLLRGAAPQTWEQFVVAMREYAAAVTAEMVRCPPEQLQRAQGMAIAANEIAVLLREAPKLKDNMIHGTIQRKPVGPYA